MALRDVGRRGSGGMGVRTSSRRNGFPGADGRRRDLVGRHAVDGDALHRLVLLGRSAHDRGVLGRVRGIVVRVCVPLHDAARCGRGRGGLERRNAMQHGRFRRGDERRRGWGGGRDRGSEPGLGRGHGCRGRDRRVHHEALHQRVGLDLRPRHHRELRARRGRVRRGRSGQALDVAAGPVRVHEVGQRGQEAGVLPRAQRVAEGVQRGDRRGRRHHPLQWREVLPCLPLHRRQCGRRGRRGPTSGGAGGRSRVDRFGAVPSAPPCHRVTSLVRSVC